MAATATSCMQNVQQTYPLAEEMKIDIAFNCKVRQVPTMYLHSNNTTILVTAETHVILIHVVMRARNKLAQSAKCCSSSEHVMLLHCVTNSRNISALTILDP